MAEIPGVLGRHESSEKKAECEQTQEVGEEDISLVDVPEPN